VKTLLKDWIKSGVLAVVQKQDGKRNVRDYVRPGVRPSSAVAPLPKGGALQVGQVERQSAPPPPL
jgi:hypothetical protein